MAVPWLLTQYSVNSVQDAELENFFMEPTWLRTRYLHQHSAPQRGCGGIGTLPSVHAPPLAQRPHKPRCSFGHPSAMAALLQRQDPSCCLRPRVAQREKRPAHAHCQASGARGGGSLLPRLRPVGQVLLDVACHCDHDTFRQDLRRNAGRHVLLRHPHNQSTSKGGSRTPPPRPPSEATLVPSESEAARPCATKNDPYGGRPASPWPCSHGGSASLLANRTATRPSRPAQAVNHRRPPCPAMNLPRLGCPIGATTRVHTYARCLPRGVQGRRAPACRHLVLFGMQNRTIWQPITGPPHFLPRGGRGFRAPGCRHCR
jgi:hypothetical protein